MDDILTQLNHPPKNTPKQIRYIAIYNLINFWGSLILSAIAFMLYIILIPQEQFTLNNSVVIAICLAGVVIFNYFILNHTKAKTNQNMLAKLIYV